MYFSFHLSIEKQHETTGGSPSSLLPVNQRQNSAVVSRFAFTPVLRNQNCACLAKGDLKEKQNRFNGFKTMKCSVTAADSPSVKLLRLSAAFFGSSVTRPLHGLCTIGKHDKHSGHLREAQVTHPPPSRVRRPAVVVHMDRRQCSHTRLFSKHL